METQDWTFTVTFAFLIFCLPVVVRLPALELCQHGFDSHPGGQGV